MAIAGASLPVTASAAGGVRVRTGIVYGSAKVGAPAAGSAPLRLDVYEPAHRSRAARPVVVLIHGGGFKRQSRTDPGIVRTARGLAAAGIVAVSIDYRLLGRRPVPSRRVAPLVAAMPDAPISRAIAAAVDDTLTATDYLRAHAARLGIDMRRLGLVGSSAGAVTADHVGFVLDDHHIRGPRIRFVASLWGGIVVPAPGGGPVAAVQLERGEPALFAVHGTADPTVPVRLDDQLVARARAQHVRTEYLRIPGAVHGYNGTQFFTRKVVRGQTPFERLIGFARSSLR